MVLLPLKASDVNLAYAILSSRIAGLIARGIDQYPGPFPPRKTFLERQKRGHNFALYNHAKPVAIVTIQENYIPPEWSECADQQSHAWVSSLFVAPDHKYRRVGHLILDAIQAHLRQRGISRIYLDCYIDSGFLEGYYSACGYQTVAKKMFVYPDRKFSAALMKKDL